MADTVGHQIATGARIVWRCEVCRAHGAVDLHAVLAAKGPEFSLVNRRPRCRICPGRVQFEDRSGVYGRKLDTITDASEAWWAYCDAERDRLKGLGYRMVVGQWVAP